MSGIKNKIMHTRDRRRKSGSLTALKAAVILIPVLIVLCVAVVLGFGWLRYSSVQQNTTTEEPSYAHITAVSDSDKAKMLLLISPKKPLSPDYKPALTAFQNTEIDSVMEYDLQEMLKAAQQNGTPLQILEGYVSREEQNRRNEQEIERLMQENHLTRAQAAEQAGRTAPAGGQTDEQSGLSVRLDAAEGSTDSTAAFYWLNRHAFEYGFVLRYPSDKTNKTEREPDPTLFRYVGRENALQMQTLNMCLDEYMVYLDAR